MNLMRLRTMQKQAQQIINQDGLFWEKKTYTIWLHLKMEMEFF
jgi:hypothetical protein